MPLTLRSSVLGIVVSAVWLSVPALARQAEPSPQTQPDAPTDAPVRQRPRGNDVDVPPNVELVRDVVYATAPSDAAEPIELAFDAAFLKNSDGKKMPAIVYIHGGGWIHGAKEDGLRQCIALALGGYFAVTIDYRLADQAIYPAAVHDCKAAVRFLKANADKLGIDPDRVGVWGHSAGGHLAALLGVSGNIAELEGDVGERGAGVSSAVHCVIDICGPTDLTRESVAGMITRWLGGPPEDRPEAARQASPLTHVDASDPPTLIIHGTEDELVNVRHAKAFEKALREAGVNVEYLPIEGGTHAIREPRAYLRAAEFFDEHLGGQAAQTIRQAAGERGGRRRPQPTQ